MATPPGRPPIGKKPPTSKPTTNKPEASPAKPMASRPVAPTRPETRGTAKPISIPQEELEFTYVRSSGAGGQNVNKVSSKAVLRWNPHLSRALNEPQRARFLEAYSSKLTKEGELILTSDRHRDQGRNTADALEKLREMINLIAKPPKARKATKPTFGSKQRRLKTKKVNSDKKAGRRWSED